MFITTKQCITFDNDKEHVQIMEFRTTHKDWHETRTKHYTMFCKQTEERR